MMPPSVRVELPWLPAHAGRWLIMPRFKRRIIPPRRNQPALYDQWAHSEYPTYHEHSGIMPSYLYQQSRYEDIWEYACGLPISWTPFSEMLEVPSAKILPRYISIEDRRRGIRIRELRKRRLI